MTVGRPVTALTGSASTPARPTVGRGEPARSRRTPRRRAPAAHQNATRQPLAAPRAPSRAAIVRPGGERHAVDAHREPAPPAAGDDRHGLQPGREVQPGAGAEEHLGGDEHGESVGEGGDDAARRRCRQAGEHQGTGAEAAEHRSADEVGGGDRQREQTERQAGLALGHAELGGNLRHHRRERLLADGDAEIGEADEAERAPAGRGLAGEALSSGSAATHLGYCMQSVLHLDDRTMAELVDPRCRAACRRRAFAAWGRARRRRPSGCGRQDEAAAWPRRWPPSCRPTAAASSTPPTPAVHVPQRPVPHRRQAARHPRR